MHARVVRRQLAGVRSLCLPCELDLRWSALAESAFLPSHLPGLTGVFQGTLTEQRNIATCLRLRPDGPLYSHLHIRWLGPKLLFCHCFVLIKYIVYVYICFCLAVYTCV